MFGDVHDAHPNLMPIKHLYKFKIELSWDGFDMTGALHSSFPAFLNKEPTQAGNLIYLKQTSVNKSLNGITSFSKIILSRYSSKTL